MNRIVPAASSFDPPDATAFFADVLAVEEEKSELARRSERASVLEWSRGELLLDEASLRDARLGVGPCVSLLRLVSDLTSWVRTDDPSFARGTRPSNILVWVEAPGREPAVQLLSDGAALLLEQLTGDATVAEVAERMSATFDLDIDALFERVWTWLDEGVLVVQSADQASEAAPPSVEVRLSERRALTFEAESRAPRHEERKISGVVPRQDQVHAARRAR